MNSGKSKRRGTSLVEALEARKLLSAQQIDGVVYQGNTLQAGVPNVTVFVDANANATLDDGEVFTSSDDTGHFSITTESNPQQLRALPPEGFIFNRVFSVQLSDSAPIYYLDLTRIRVITGAVYQDTNNDKQPDDGDRFFAGVTIYIDHNANNQFDDGETSALTDEQGQFSLLTAASLESLAMIAPAGWVIDNTDTLIRLDGNLRNFRIAPTPTIAPAPSSSGTLYNDQNLNGNRDSAEAGVSGIFVFVDYNNNGIRDGNEPTAITDADGLYSFPSVTGGTLRIRASGLNGSSELRPTSYVNAAPNHSYTLDVPIYQSKTVTGIVYLDSNRNGVRDESETSVADALVYAPFSYAPPTSGSTASGGTIAINGHPCTFSLSNYFPQNCVTNPDPIVQGDLRKIYQQTASDGSFTLNDMPLSDLTVAIDSKKFVRTTSVDDQGEHQEIGVLPIPQYGFGVAEVHGRVFDDVNNNGVFDAGEKLLSAVLVDAGERAQTASFAVFSTDSVTIGGTINVGGGRHSVDVSGTSDTDGNFVLQGLPQGNFSLSAIYGPRPFDSDPIDFTLDALEAKTLDLPVHLYCRMTGQVLGDGSPQVQASLVNDGTIVYLDRNNNQKLDAGEPSTTTIQGTYYFDHVPDGPYTVRIMENHARIVGQLPHGVASHDQVITNPPINIDHPFSKVPIRVYLDLNSNGRKEAKEPFLQKGMIFLDRDDDGLVDENSSYGFKSDKGRLSFDFEFGTTHITLQTRPASKLGQYSKSVRINITNSAKPPNLMIGLRRHRHR